VTRVLRWASVAALVVAVLLLHLLAGHWVNQQKRLLRQTAEVKPPLEVLLLQAQVIRQTAPNPALPASKPVRPKPAAVHRTPRTGAVEAPVMQALADPAEAVAPGSASDAAAASAVAAAAAGSATASAASGGNTANTANTARTQKDGEQFSLPPTADLRYDTFFNGVQNTPGTVSWVTDGQIYDVMVSVPLPFVGKYTYHSRGRVDAFGLAPERYIEQRGARAQDETDFDRSAKRIGFTRTPTTLALPDGAQDRFSMVFQLTSLVRGNPARYTPGVTRSFYVVDKDSGENWPIEMVGTDSIRMGETYVSALHFMRLPRHQDDNRKIDVWLAPALGYFPVRIMQTEPNGTQIELLLHDAPRRLEALSESAGGSPAATRPAASAAEPGSAPGQGSVPIFSPAAPNSSQP